MRRALGLVTAVAVALSFAPISVFAQCALCREALTSGGNAGLIKGFYWSIVLIAGIPLVIMAVVAVVAWRSWRSRQTVQSHEAIQGITDA